MGPWLALAACTADPGTGVGVPGARAVIRSDPPDGAWPLTVTFDASASTAPGTFAWDFGDGATAAGAVVRHTYVGEGSFTATLTVGDATAESTVDVRRPECPAAAAPQRWGLVLDPELQEISGVAPSPTDPDVLWVVEDANNPDELVAINTSGAVLGRFPFPDGGVSDAEDLASGVDPTTGDPVLYVSDFGNNNADKTEFAVWIVPEPDPRSGGARLTGVRMALVYPDTPKNSETLLLDPRTTDLYVVTKADDGEAVVYRKAAPHEGEGPYTLEWVTDLDFSKPPLGGDRTTGGAVSADGGRFVIRTYDDTAWMWLVDGYRPFDEAFDTDPCPIPIAEEEHGETVTFARDGAGLLTISEGTDPPVWYVPIDP